jgi:hypothetical protein
VNALGEELIQFVKKRNASVEYLKEQARINKKSRQTNAWNQAIQISAQIQSSIPYGRHFPPQMPDPLSASSASKHHTGNFYHASNKLVKRSKQSLIKLRAHHSNPHAVKSSSSSNNNNYPQIKKRLSKKRKISGVTTGDSSEEKMDTAQVAEAPVIKNIDVQAAKQEMTSSCEDSSPVDVQLKSQDLDDSGNKLKRESSQKREDQQQPSQQQKKDNRGGRSIKDMITNYMVERFIEDLPTDWADYQTNLATGGPESLYDVESERYYDGPSRGTNIFKINS